MVNCYVCKGVNLRRVLWLVLTCYFWYNFFFIWYLWFSRDIENEWNKKLLHREKSSTVSPMRHSMATLCKNKNLFIKLIYKYIQQFNINLNLLNRDTKIYFYNGDRVSIEIFDVRRKNSYIHREKSFQNLVKSNQNRIVFTIFRLIWN